MKRSTLSNWPLHLLLLPAVILLLVYCYGPMFGIVIAFQKFIPAKGFLGSDWIGFDNFRYILSLSDMREIMWNTVYISVMKIIAGVIVPLTVSLLLNEIRHRLFKRGVQTLIYLPHFLSWVILGGILVDILSPSTGIVNAFLGLFGINPVYFLGENSWFPYVLVISDIWKEFGFSTIIYLAALTGINPSLYEAAVMDGASRIKQIWHITLPGIRTIVVLLMTLSLGNVLNAGFEQVFNLYSPQVYDSGDIIDTYVYRMGLISAQYGPATAIGLFKSVISLVLISTTYYLAYKFAKYRIF
ncbi:protein lplB [Paenibacillus sp. MY03]|jgi:putative aldouronate transport system permease protein|uniref:ABC transporter permease n=1 Tax=Paenibacillus sp. MY03 TaxID=302980 RepID=UPI000B3CD868|nr:ABC transporter permease subunit [Paenibacillus sp. MY03]OUS77769.1 protein lplB [Paenibacillus sp. MY03]